MENEIRSVEQKDSVRSFFWRVTALHMITYAIAGVLAVWLFNYKEVFEAGDMAGLMRPFDSPWISAGMGLQVVRGLVFSLVLWPFRKVFTRAKLGWLKLWGLFLGLAILGTAGPAPGSLEGIIFTKLPILGQILGLREVVFQTLLFSLGLYYWYEKPKKIYNILSVVLVVLIILMSLAGVFLA